MDIIEAKNISFAYNGANALEDVSFTLKAGSFTGLLGPNGSGKTTLIKIILGLLKPQKGYVKLLGADIHNFKSWRDIGYLEQKNTPPSIMPLTAFEVARLGLLSTKTTPKFFNKADTQKTLETMQTAGCAEYKDKIFYELSGGQQQRVLLARALINNPKLLILDEPSTALDAISRENFFNLLLELKKQKNTTVLLVTHDIADVGKHVDNFLILDKTLIFHGAKAAFCRADSVTKYFGPYTPHLMDHLHGSGICPLEGHK